MNKLLEKKELTINVSPVMLLILTQTIENNQEGLLKYLEKNLGFTLSGQEDIKEVIRELKEVAKKDVGVNYLNLYN
jgi:hypothetical protein